MLASNLIFSLDIGTRTVIGVVGIEDKGKLNIIASDVVEHKERAMMDGQVHDIGKVAEAVITVKKNLEEKVGVELKSASIAAAGRVLKTKQVYVEANLEFSKAIENDDVCNLEMEGIQLAQYQLDEELSDEEKVLYYCVGYSIVNYYLNNYVISNLIGHKGKKIGADMIATFLPNSVVDSLYSVMKIAQLEVANLTLEPIAAINVAIPKDLRLLNLALVDIGAGTSDIAITREGTVVGFDMVPVAGDEITEAICHSYIVDFNTAEKIKTSNVGMEDEVSYTDILGNSKKLKYSEIINDISKSIDYLAETISNKIMEFNKKAPQAVFLVGGGSQIKMLDKLIASKLGLPEDRVAVRKSNIIHDVLINDSNLGGPDAITPIGIAVTTMTQPGYGFISVKVNGIKVRLYNSRKLHIADAVILAGYKPTDLIGRSGKALNYEVNGSKKHIQGSIGKPSEIKINGVDASMQTEISNGDDIYIKTAQDGESAKLTLLEVLADFEGDYEVYVNGDQATPDYIINDNDKIEIIDMSDKNTKINNSNTAEKEVKFNSITVSVNDEVIVISGNKEKFIFVDIFDFYSFDLQTLKGRLVTKLNGSNASFTDTLEEGDNIEIYWA